MNFADATDAIRALIVTEWAASAYADMPVIFDDETPEYSDSFMALSIQGTMSEKTIYGSAGKRSSLEFGMVYIHAFVPTGSGTRRAFNAVVAMSQILELKNLAIGINLEGANPPSPIAMGTNDDPNLPTKQPAGNYYRCSGSVPFLVIDVR